MQKSCWPEKRAINTAKAARKVMKGVAPHSRPIRVRGPRTADGTIKATLAPASAALVRISSTYGKFEKGRESGQLLLPVLDLAIQHPIVQLLIRPESVVGKLQRQHGQVRRGLCRESLVANHQLFAQDEERLKIGDDVMDVHKQDIMIRRNAEEMKPHQRRKPKIEGPLRMFANQYPAPGGRFRFGKRSQVREADLRMSFRRNGLVEVAILFVKAGPEDFMPRKEHVNRPLENLKVQ